MYGNRAGLSGPTREYVRNRLSSLLQEICHRTPEEIQDTATIDRELEMESVQMVELQVAVETEFDITLDFLEVLRLNSFRRITEYVHALASASADSSAAS